MTSVSQAHDDRPLRQAIVTTHPAVKPGTYCISYIMAQLKNSHLAVLPGEIAPLSKKKSCVRTYCVHHSSLRHH